MAVSKKTIERWNAFFNGLTKAEKRVAIAKDVLAQIKAGRYQPAHCYSLISNGDSNESFQKQFNDVECRCCADGALLLSMVKYKNVFTIGDLNGLRGSSTIWRSLAKVFTPRQLFFIECAYEQRRSSEFYAAIVATDSLNFRPTEKDWDIVNQVSRYYLGSSTDRLINIMKNIVKNNGEFKPLEYAGISKS